MGVLFHIKLKRLEPQNNEVEEFINKITFQLPKGFLDFFSQSNGATISGEEKYAILWPLTKILELNLDYNVEEYAPDFFIFGSDGHHHLFL